MADIKPIRGGIAKGDQLALLATLFDVLEAKTYPVDPPDPVNAIKFRMEHRGLTRKDLEGIIGSRARIADVLSGKRNLSIAMNRRLNEALKILAEILSLRHGNGRIDSG
jgi:HTH-type transcriptional regulator / antitoxin HigA